MPEPIEIDDDIRARTIALLLGAAETSTEIQALGRIARRAGFLWRCTCREDNYADRGTCRCGKPRPAAT